MEDVLAVYEREPDPDVPLVCLDEFCKQLLSEVAPPLAAKPAAGGAPGRRERHDAEYVREGSASAFMLAMPHLGKREVFIGRDASRTALDYADAIAWLCDGFSPTPGKSSWCRTTSPIAVQLSRRRRPPKVEVHYTRSMELAEH
ncbi:MAG: hypothetical protein R3F11_23825 [Verrucomicrobiales bacterium]